MEPHPVLRSRYASRDAKPEFVDRLFDQGAPHYDAIVDWGFLRSGSFYRRWVQRHHGLRPGHHLLDVACGTGLVAVEAEQILGTAANITCLDPSAGMLAVARTKLTAMTGSRRRVRAGQRNCAEVTRCGALFAEKRKFFSKWRNLAGKTRTEFVHVAPDQSRRAGHFAGDDRSCDRSG